MEFSIHLKKILVPTDFSDHADLALRHAWAIAGWSGAELLVIHVVEKFMDHSVLYSDVWPFQKPVNQYYQELEERTARRLEKQAEESAGGNLRYRVIVTTGTPSVEIAAAAKSEEVDLIVIATHGRGGLAQTILGSTTDKVLRRASSPVLVIRSGERGFVRAAD